jgi:hypothetical protein
LLNPQPNYVDPYATQAAAQTYTMLNPATSQENESFSPGSYYGAGGGTGIESSESDILVIVIILGLIFLALG